MKKILFLFLFNAILQTVCAQADYEYQPFVEEGKMWSVTYWTHEGTSSYKRVYTIKGDTIIEGKQYKKLFSDDRYIYALREEDKKVYAIASTDKYGKPNTKEVEWYNFGVNEGDIIDWGYTCMSVEKIGYIVVNGVRRKCFHLIETGKDFSAQFYVRGIWVEGIGSYRGPLSFNRWDADGGTATMDVCYENDQCLFTYEDFIAAAPYMDNVTGANLTGVTQTSATFTHISAPLFDLQGRRLQNEPSQGIYIRDGRKYIGK